MKYIQLFLLFLFFNFNVHAQEYNWNEFTCLNEINANGNHYINKCSVNDKSGKTDLLSESYAPINAYIDSEIISSSLIEKSLTNTEKSSFHLFSHGRPGELLIEGQWKDAKQIVHWFEDNKILKKQKQLNIYGCEFAKDKKGKAAVQYLEAALNIYVAASDDITGIDGDWELEIGAPTCQLYLSEYNYNLQTCTPSNFTWDDGAGGGQVFPAESQSESYTINTANGPITVTLDIIDPLNRNGDSDSHDVGSHPFDPSGGCEPQGLSGTPGCNELTDNITGNGSINDPWDSDCNRSFTQTNGVYGPDYLTLFMYTANSSEEVEYRFTFSRSVNIDDFRISDIDAIGFINNLCSVSTLGDSYQDEVRLSATDLCGDDVPLNIQATTDATQTQIIIDNANQSATSEYGNFDANIDPNDQNGEIIVNTTSSITTLSLFYSNGPDDAAYEQNNPAEYSWWSDTYGTTNGVSDDQAIRLDGFDFCACPEFNIGVIGSGCDNDDSITFGVTSDYTISRLLVDGVAEPTTSSFTVFPPYNATYEVVVESSNGCKDSYTFITTIGSAATSSLTESAISCSDNADGSVDLTVTSGTAYTVDWSNIAGTNDPEDQTGLGAGTYTSTITTVDGCVTIDSITLVAPSSRCLPITIEKN